MHLTGPVTANAWGTLDDGRFILCTSTVQVKGPLQYTGPPAQARVTFQAQTSVVVGFPGWWP